MKQHLDVVAALIIVDNRMLLCQRKACDTYPLVWEFPGGCVEEGESYREAIEREIDEELGLKVDASTEIGRFDDEDATLHISVSLIRCHVSTDTPYARDCKDWGYFDLIGVEALNLGPVDRKICNHLKTVGLL